MFDLTTRDIKYLSGVGPQRASVLNKELGIFSFHDLLYYFPYKYVDRSRIYRIREIDGAMPYIQLKGEILGFETAGEGRQRRLIAHFSDGTGIVDLIWFQGIRWCSASRAGESVSGRGSFNCPTRLFIIFSMACELSELRFIFSVVL